LDRESFGAASLERPALVRLDDGWRLYFSCATPGSKHWTRWWSGTGPAGAAGCAATPSTSWATRTV
ncbi:hypothetical protein, partial [uncultured Arsenicicoccus sp.]